MTDNLKNLIDYAKKYSEITQTYSDEIKLAPALKMSHTACFSSNIYSKIISNGNKAEKASSSSQKCISVNLEYLFGGGLKAKLPFADKEIYVKSEFLQSLDTNNNINKQMSLDEFLDYYVRTEYENNLKDFSSEL